jgi:hypothetical protein
MLKTILIIFIILWLLGFIHVGLLAFPLFTFGAITLTLQNLLYFIIILFLISLLPGIFRIIAIILLFLWLFSTFGFLLIGGLTNIILLILIIVVIFSLV